MPTFENIQDINSKLTHFAEREVGITHPDVTGFIRIRNNGDIEIVAGEGLAIVLNPHSNSITFVADHIKFMTKHEGGLRWNDLSFNDRATNFSEPTLVKVDDAREGYGLYKGVDHFTPEAEEPEHTGKDDLDDMVKRFE